MLPDNNVDLHLSRRGHGWTRATIFLPESTHEFIVTHIFAEPICEIARCAVRLLEGAVTASFAWQDEPGRYEFNFERHRESPHVMNVTISEFAEYSGGKRRSEIAFQVTLRQWIALVAGELQKISLLLSEPSYKKTRDSEFPSKELATMMQFLAPAKHAR